MKHLQALASLFPIILLLFCCNEKEETFDPAIEFEDLRDGQIYAMVEFPEIGQKWMAEN